MAQVNNLQPFCSLDMYASVGYMAGANQGFILLNIYNRLIILSVIGAICLHGVCVMAYLYYTAKILPVHFIT